MKQFLSFLMCIGVAWTASGQHRALSDAHWPSGVRPVIAPDSFRELQLNAEELGDFLHQVPSHGSHADREGVLLVFPFPDGTDRAYKVVEERVMAEALQKRFPQIRTYSGIAADGLGGTVHFDLTERGFHAMMLTPGQETVYIDPADRDGSSGLYLAYSRSAFYATSSKTHIACDARTAPNATSAGPTGKLLRMGLDMRQTNGVKSMAVPNGSQLRTYRLALACTGEYAAFHGGTTSGALSAMATSMVRINGVYHRDVAIHMELVASNDAIVFLNGSTDPYTNNNGGTMLGENQTTCDNIIGSANYDIGHVFSTGGGGVAYLQSPCQSFKAGGVTGGGSPVGDPFDIDYVCHEMGHQFGGNHTQNNACNRSTNAAYEPGSASTIMGYAGICAPNLQSNSDDHFHNHSYNEIIAYTVNGAGNSCAVVTSSGNTPPSVDAGTSGLTIPRSTPFELTATASDPDASSSLTYNWEQYDLGPATASGDNNLTNPTGNQPIFRSWPSSESPTRVFPKLESLVNNTSIIGELLPTYGRSMNFKCTVRDNQVTGGVGDDLISINVDGSSGPFLVVSPNGGQSIQAGIPTEISWDVANTDLAPVNCNSVNIWLSVDGGFSWPYLVATEETNDGLASVILPNVPTSTARIKVKASGNHFFDISNNNFILTAASNPAELDVWVTNISNGSGELCGESISPSATITNLGNNAVTSFDVTFSIDGGADEVTIEWSGNLSYLQSVEIDACSTGPCLNATAGVHDLQVVVDLPPGLVDEVPGNNTLSSAFESGCFEGCAECGCTDEVACNYNSGASIDDGSCTYSLPGQDCICLTAISMAGTVGASEALTSTLNGIGTLDTLDVAVTFTTSGNSWPADLLLAICDPSGTCVEYGGYDISLGYTDAGTWPSSWQSTASGVYSMSIVLSSFGLNGEGEWSISAVNAYAASGAVNYDIDLALHGVCELELVPGCSDSNACNYDPSAQTDDGSCTYPEAPYLDCIGDCLMDSDADGICDELEIPGCTDESACNFDPLATDSADCTYAEAGLDCEGNPLSSCPEDFNNNGLVEIQDLLILLGDFGCTESPCPADLNGDGITSIADMLALLSAFGTTCW